MLLKSANETITTCSPFVRVTTVGAWSRHTLSITVLKLALASLKVRMFMLFLPVSEVLFYPRDVIGTADIFVRIIVQVVVRSVNVCLKWNTLSRPNYDGEGK